MYWRNSAGPGPNTTMGGSGIVFNTEEIPPVGFFPTGDSKFTELFLTAPIKGDMIQMIPKGKILRNRNGELKSTTSGGRIKYILTLTFIAITDMTDIETFLKDSNGSLVDYTDHRGNTWRGVIMNPDANRVFAGRQSNNFTVELEGISV